ncbi:hypothetical protein WN944_017631 [Citrus x changshan-huyou]|uniref:Fructokinase n=1 Tax=Citrus x changshan-huyou TaxID=2935761 RepID=A0AAP0MFY3_9ROSI
MGTCWLIFSRKITLTTLASVLTHMQGLHWLFVTLTAEGERGFMFFRNPSAEMLLCEAELDVNLIEKASILLKPRRSAHIAAMEMAKTSGRILSYDPNVRLLPWPSAEAARGGIISIWDEADMIKRSFSTPILSFCSSPRGQMAANTTHRNLRVTLVVVLLIARVDTTGAGNALFVQYRKLRAKGAVPALLTEAEVLRYVAQSSFSGGD